jgi:Bacterial lectin
LCNSSTASWVLNGTSPGTSSSSNVPFQNTSACTIEMTNGGNGEHAAVYWPTLISTAHFSVSFTVAISAPGDSTPADGFTMVLADPSQGATTSSLGAVGEGLGAKGIPGFVLGFDTFQNGDLQTDPSCGVGCDPVPVPYMAVGQGATALWENPWSFVNGDLDVQNSTDFTPEAFANATHNYVVTVVNGVMTVTLDDFELFSGTVSLPPSAFLGFTASTGSDVESVTFSNLTATISAP